jgi:hypothetical protein
VYFLLSALNDILDRGRRHVGRRGSLVDNAARLISLEESLPPAAADVPAAAESPPAPLRGLSPQASVKLTFGSDPHLGPVVEVRAAALAWDGAN